MTMFNGLAERYGARLEELSAVEKLDVIAFLAFWQSADTDRQESGNEGLSVEEAIEDHDYLTPNVQAVVEEAQDLSGLEVVDWIIAIAQQIKDGFYSVN